MPRQPAEPDRHGRPDAGRDGRRADAPRPGDAPAGRFAQDRRGFDGRGRGDAPPRMDRPGRPAPGAEASHGRFRAEDARRGQPDPRAEGRRPPEDRRAGWGERPTREQRAEGPERPARGGRPLPPDRPRNAPQPWRERDYPPAADRPTRRDAARPQPVPTTAPAARPAGAPAIGERLNKRLADMRLCSRREADEWIERGWVRVNGEVAVMGQRVRPNDEVQVDERAKVKQAERVTILLNKPVGYVSGQAEDGHEPAASLISAQSRWRGDANSRRFASWQLRGLAPAGRLDIDSVGLLVLTQDGRVARDIIGEDSEVEKEYLVRVHYMPDGAQGRVVERDVQAAFPPEQLARLRHGLALDGQPLLPAEVEWQNPEQLRFVLREGKKRQIRRMCEQVGLHVVGLKRIRIGGVVLGNLPTGQWRFLGPHERF
jgi:23S rRNA pseudouridine2604 synthase